MGCSNVTRAVVGNRVASRDLVSIWDRPAVIGRLPLCVPGAILALFGDMGLSLNDTSVTFPNDFDNAAWVKTASSVAANATADPFGGNLADSLIEDGSNGGHSMAQAVTGSVGGFPVTHSIYAKASGRSWINVYNGVAANVYFNVATGVLGTVTGATATIAAVGNGWFLCTMTSTAGGSGFTIQMASANGTVAYQGNGVGNVFLFGASVSQPKVSALADQSVSAFSPIQATATAQPLAVTSSRTQRALRFVAASSTFLKRAATNALGAANYSAVGAALWRAAATPRQVMWGVTDTLNGGMYYGPADAGATGLREVGYVAASSADDGLMSKAAPEVHSILYGGGVDTALRVNQADQVIAPLAAMVNPGGAAALRIGTYADASLPADQDFFLLFLYSRKVSVLERNRLEAYSSNWVGVA